MRVGRRAFLGVLASVPFLQLPASVPASPVAGWAFVWHGWRESPTREVTVGFWAAHTATRAIVNPIEVPRGQETLATARHAGYAEIVEWARAAEARPLPARFHGEG